MGSYGEVYLEKLNLETKQWELFSLYNKNKKDNTYRQLPLWEGQGLIRDMLDDRSPYGLIDYSEYIDVDKPDNFMSLSYELNNKYHKYDIKSPITGEIYNTLNPKAITYGQLYMYLQEHPEIEDPYEENWEEDINGEMNLKSTKIKNPLYELLNRINFVIDMKDDWNFSFSESYKFRIVYWIS